MVSQIVMEDRSFLPIICTRLNSEKFQNFIFSLNHKNDHFRFSDQIKNYPKNDYTGLKMTILKFHGIQPTYGTYRIIYMIGNREITLEKAWKRIVSG